MTSLSVTGSSTEPDCQRSIANLVVFHNGLQFCGDILVSCYADDEGALGTGKRVRGPLDEACKIIKECRLNFIGTANLGESERRRAMEAAGLEGKNTQPRRQAPNETSCNAGCFRWQGQGQNLHVILP